MKTANDLIKELSKDLGVLPRHLQSVIKTAPLRYKKFTVRKKNGGMRELAQPAREVKSIQRWLLNLIAPHLPIHSSVTAYRKGSSIRENARRHVDSSYTLKMDFTDFFPSILREDLIRHMQTHCSDALDDSAIKLATYVFTWAPKRSTPLRLCVGAPSSPALSNSVLFDFDRTASEKSEEDSVIYTRYADDLTFSSKTKGALSAYPEFVASLAKSLDYPCLRINERKTVFASRAGHRSVTGLVLTPDHRISIGRDRKRLIRSMYHRDNLGLLSQEKKNELEGLIAFAEDIEPGFRVWLERSVRDKGG